MISKIKYFVSFTICKKSKKADEGYERSFGKIIVTVPGPVTYDHWDKFQDSVLKELPRVSKVCGSEYIKESFVILNFIRV